MDAASVVAVMCMSEMTRCGGVVCCRRHLIISCQGSLNIFPFDDPLCSFAMESSEYLPSAKCPAAAEPSYTTSQITPLSKPIQPEKNALQKR
jgi:hypothetical protein